MKPKKPSYNSFRKKIIKKKGRDSIAQNIRHGETLIPVGDEQATVIIPKAKSTHTYDILKTEDMKGNLNFGCGETGHLRGLLLTNNEDLSITPISEGIRSINLNPDLADGSWVEMLSEGNDWFCWGWAGNIDLVESESPVFRGSKKLDLDDDLLTVAQEEQLGTDPTNPDTDGGGVIDGVEYALELNPLDPSDDYKAKLDTDNDTFTDEEEVLAGTNWRDINHFPGSTEDTVQDSEDRGPNIDGIPANLNIQPLTNETTVLARIQDLIDGNEIKAWDSGDEDYKEVTFIIKNYPSPAEHNTSFKVTFSATDSLGNTTEQERTYTIADTTAPTITLVGDAVMTVTIGSIPQDPGATATDAYGSPPTIYSSWAVDVEAAIAAGTANVEYYAIDSVGNRSDSVYRTVTIQEAAVVNNLPTITIAGDDPLIIEAGTSEENATAAALVGVTADDGEGVNITASIEVTFVPPYDPAHNFDSTITYTVTDGVNDPVTATRSLQVRDEALPTITINVASPYKILEGQAPAQAPSATATDDVLGDISGYVTNDWDQSALDDLASGETQTITYTIDNGVNAVTTATLEVVITSAPTFSGIQENLEIGEGTPLVNVQAALLAGVTASDAEDGPISLDATNLTVNTYSDTILAGNTFDVTYSVTDNDGNTTTESKTYSVIAASTGVIPETIIVDDDLFNSSELLEVGSPTLLTSGLIYQFDGTQGLSFNNGFKYDPWAVSGSSPDGVIDNVVGYPARTVGDLSPARTYSIWYNADSVPASPSAMTLFWKGGPQYGDFTDDGWSITLLNVDNASNLEQTIRVSNEGGIIKAGGGNYLDSAENTWSAGSWQHLVVVWGITTSTAKMYHNGIELNNTRTTNGNLETWHTSTSGGGDPTSDSEYHGDSTEGGRQQVLRIGLDSGLQYGFVGKIALPKIYHGELTQEQITGLYDSGAAEIAEAELTANAQGGVVGGTPLELTTNAQAVYDSASLEEAGTEYLYSQASNTSSTTTTRIVDGIVNTGTGIGYYIDAGTSYNFIDQVTVSLWFKGNPTSGTRIISNNIAPNWGGWFIAISGGALQIRSFDSRTFNGSWDNVGNGLNDNNWHHIVVSYEQSATNGLNVWIDGTPAYTRNTGPSDATTSWVNPANSTSEDAPMMIAANPSTGWNFNGNELVYDFLNNVQIDSVKVLNSSSLVDEDVASLYNYELQTHS